MKLFSSYSWLRTLAVVLLACFLTFVAGAYVSEFRSFPYHEVFENPFNYLHAVKERHEMEAEAAAEVEEAMRVHPHVTIAATPQAYDGYTFLTYDVGRPSTARLLDMQGNVLHEWHRSFRDIWPTAPHVQTPSPETAISWRYGMLFPNGDIIVTIISYGDTPYGYGMVKLDKDSKVIWAAADHFHHQFSVADNGNIVGLTHDWRDLREHPIHGERDLPKRILEDFVVELSPDGKELSRISLLNALVSGGFRELVDSSFINDFKAKDWDPLHANDVEIITPEFSSHHPFMKPGNLLISLRELDALVLLDVNKKIVTWAMRGSWARQHDPDLLANGNLLLFDNRGPNLKDGGSRVLEFDPDTGRVLWYYTGSPEQPFRSDKSGGAQRLPNGNTLISEDDDGRLFEVTQKGVIAWEYRDVRLHQATRVTKDWLKFVPSALASKATTAPAQ